MKMRVMFVDDDLMLLEGTRRQLGTAFQDCEFDFCQSGSEAIDRAASQPPDVIFTDIRMPIMDGPTLLQHIAQTHPDTVRFAWTGQLDEPQLTRTLSVAHQIFAKPCDRKVVRNAITRVAKLRDALSGSWLRPRLVDLNRVPSSGKRAADLAILLEGSDGTIDQIANGIDSEPMAQARLICLANSSFFASDLPVITTTEAVARVGIATSKSLFIDSMLPMDNTIGKKAIDEMTRLTRQGLKAATRAGQIARQEKLDRYQIRVVTLAAMFHQFGKILFLIHGKREYLQFLENDEATSSRLRQQEQQLFGASQTNVGAYTLFIWGMNDAVCQAISNLDSLPRINSSIDRVLQAAINDDPSSRIDSDR